MRKRKLLLVALLLLLVSTIYAQTHTITGTVKDEAGSPIPNASVSVRGTSSGTVTNSQGDFSINVPSNRNVLVITAVGMQVKTVAINGAANLNVVLTIAENPLEEVVIIAYGKTKKEALTGSVGVIKADNIERRPVANVLKAIEGATPGITVTTGSGQPGSKPDIRIRGFGSINASSDPLIVVDGVPYAGDISNINPDDVESLTILKDAASTALFGSRGANGVIMITSKRGRKNQNTLSVKLAQGYSSRGIPEYDRVNAFQYYPLMWQAYRNSLVYPNSGTGISLDSANKVASGLTTRNGIADLLSYNPFNVAGNAIVGVDGKLNPNARLLYGDDLNWEDYFMRTGSRKDYGVNFSGGAEKSDYYMSLGYLKEDGFTKSTGFERFSARVNVNTQPKKWIKTSLNIAGNYSVLKNSNEDGAIANPYSWSRNLGPIYPVYLHDSATGAYVLDENGNKIPDIGNYEKTPLGTQYGLKDRIGTSYLGRNAPLELMLNEDNIYRTSVSGRWNTDLMIVKGLVFTNTLSVDLQSQRESSYENTIVGDGAGLGRSNKIYGSNSVFQATQLLTYDGALGAHHFNVLLGHESYNQTNTNLDGFRQGQSLTGNTEFPNFTTTNSLTSLVDKYRVESYFSRLIYDFDNKYNFTASLRRDGNSRFSRKSRWGTFGSVGVGWNMHRESFLENILWINQLKLRSSYGVVGVADGIGYYAYQGLYNFSNNANEPGIVQSQSAYLNEDLTWEKNKAFDAGIEFALFKNRLRGQVEYYNRISADLLFAVPTPLSSGALTNNKNTATMYNKGIELQLGGDVVSTPDWLITTQINISTVKNRITQMPETVKEFVNGTKKYSEGYSIYDYWLRQYYGVDPTDGAALFAADVTTAGSNIRYIDNKNGGVDTVTTSLSNAKYAYNGSAIPNFYGSITQRISYKGISLSALLTFQKGGLIYDGQYAGLMSVGTYGAALHTNALNAWQKPGDVTNVPRMDNGRTGDFNATTSNRWLTNASFINIRTVSLSYQLPRAVTNRLTFNSMQVYLTGENLNFFTKRKGMNPQNAFSGVTGSGYPPARIITVGIRANL